MHGYADDFGLDIAGNRQAVAPEATDVGLNRLAGVADRFLSRVALRLAAGQRRAVSNVAAILCIRLKDDSVFHQLICLSLGQA